MNGRYNKKERRHVGLVKEMPCGVCGAPGPSEAHHIEQHKHFLTIPLCRRCHSQVPNGPMWKIYKVTEYDVLNATISGIYAS